MSGNQQIPPSLRQANDTEAFLAALAGGLNEDFPNDIDETDLEFDTPRGELD